MSGNAKSKVKTEENLLEKFIPQSFIKLRTAVLAWIENILSMENALSGIQIYGDMED
jgi:hypothetical protein